MQRNLTLVTYQVDEVAVALWHDPPPDFALFFHPPVPVAVACQAYLSYLDSEHTLLSECTRVEYSAGLPLLPKKIGVWLELTADNLSCFLYKFYWCLLSRDRRFLGNWMHQYLGHYRGSPWQNLEPMLQPVWLALTIRRMPDCTGERTEHPVITRYQL